MNRATRRLIHRVGRTASVCLVWGLGVASVHAAPDVTRMWFTPAIVPETYTQLVRFEATITGNPATVAFEYNAVDRSMLDNGTSGDRVAGDGIWTIQFQASEILSKVTAAAWTHAEVLWTLRAAPHLRDAFFSRLDSFTGFAGRGLLLAGAAPLNDRRIR